MNKKQQYHDLVKKRKDFEFDNGLNNPSKTSFDTNEIEPWAQWQNDLDAEILVIGQEFSDLATYIKCKGKVERFDHKYEYPSNKNLQALLTIIRKDPGHPNKPNKGQKLFFTNCVMGLKGGKMSSNFKTKWINQSRENFLQPLIELIDPKIIICLGGMATKAVARIYGFKSESMKNYVNISPIRKENKLIFPVYHTGGLGIRNRSIEQQIQDWEKIKRHLGA